MGLNFILTAVLGLGLSGIPVFFFDRRSDLGQRLCFYLHLFSSGLGLAGLGLAFNRTSPQEIHEAWRFPSGSFDLGLDGLTLLFLFPVFSISILGSLYGLGYWKQSGHPHNGRSLRFFYGLLAFGMGLLLLARNSVLFLFSWEIMALAAFFLVAMEDDQPGVRRAAWIYWVATHLGVLALFSFFVFIKNHLGSYDWPTLPLLDGGDPWVMALFLLALVGFGLKAGVMPFHFWLPQAHSSAPSHVSAMMSGVMLNMGIYGILRVSGWVSHPPLVWGLLLLILGLASAFLGIAAAMGEGDLKKMLAYSSIENMGILFIGIGLALLGRATQHPLWTLLGLYGCLFHLLNHSLFKSLLFFCAGSVIHAAHTRRMDQLGGLISALPATGLAFALGACAACALPPLNGFVGEWILYQGLFFYSNQGRSLETVLAMVAIGSLSLVGALGLVCFTRAFGSVFLGRPRFTTPTIPHGRDPWMSVSLGILLVLCLGIGFLPVYLLPLLRQVLNAWAPEISGVPPLESLLPLGTIGQFNLLLAVSLFLILGWLAWVKKEIWFPQEKNVGTWDCGYQDASSPRLQYTASSFGEGASHLFRWATALRLYRPVIRGPFPQRSKFESVVPERLLGGFLVPLLNHWGDNFMRLRQLQQGQTSIYLFYIFIALLLALAWGSWSVP